MDERTGHRREGKTTYEISLVFLSRKNESSLGILEARGDRLPLDMKKERRKEKYRKIQSAFEKAKEVDEDIEFASEDLKQMESSIKRLDLLIKEKTIKIRRCEAKYDKEFNRERSANGKKSKAVNKSSKGSKDQGVGLQTSER
ncbi:hypothetical protein BCON_0027g00270 [Botryotinia convoluta]|uniref:Uncharacterized protein n=1 Tax=Botryotinia convoluta TaxID=54673 RepID=A0A4Z1IQ75_9HELO|nr:hypothetical protein BCON_0027g00270 [Botryotinia convoluta]